MSSEEKNEKKVVDWSSVAPAVELWTQLCAVRLSFNKDVRAVVVVRHTGIFLRNAEVDDESDSPAPPIDRVQPLNPSKVSEEKGFDYVG